MTNQHDSRCTPRSQDWKMFGTELVNTLTWPFRAGYYKAFGRGHFPANPRPFHKGRNILVEEWRRWTGKCPKEKDEHEPEVAAVDRPGPPSLDFAKRVERLLKEDQSKESGV